MTQQYIVRVSGLMKDFDPTTTHILGALLQAEQDEATEVAFGGSCRTEFGWFVGETRVGIDMPEGLSGSRVTEALITMTGLDQPGEFPKESDLVLETPESEFIVELPIDDTCYGPENIRWRQLRWRVSLSSSGGPIVLRSLR